MSYTKIGWKNYPNRSTPLSAENLNKMDDAIAQLDNKTGVQSITYSELKTLRNSGALVPGKQYRITDYVTTTIQEDTQSAGHQFDIIVTADDEKTLNENARAIIHEGDDYFHKIISEQKLVAASWKPGVTLDSITEKYKLYDDSEEYSTPKDEDKEFTEMLTITNKAGVEIPCLLNPSPDEDGNDDYLIYCGTYKHKKITNILPNTLPNTLITVYYTITEDQSQEYEGLNHRNDIFVEIAYKDINGVFTPILYKEDADRYLNDNNSVDYEDEFRYLDNYEVDGIIYNRWAKYDEFSEGRYQILTNIIVVNNQFTEEFGETTIITYDKWQECDSDGEPKSGFYVLTNNLVDAEIEYYELKYLANLAAWEIKYCLDNDTTRFAWANDGLIINLQSAYSNGAYLKRCPTFDNQNNSEYEEYQYAWGVQADIDDGDNTNFIYSKTLVLTNGETVFNYHEYAEQLAEVITGKGVIYWLKDEFNNEAPYDFKNIQFKRKISLDNGYPEYNEEDGDETWVYTFTANSYHIANDEWSELKDGSLEPPYGHQSDEYSSTYHDNIIKPYIKVWDIVNEDYTKCGIQYLNNNVFLGHYNEVGSELRGVPFHYAFCSYGCKLGLNNYSNTFGDNCSDNTFGNNCHHNTFGSYYTNNTFGDYCHENTFGNSCSNNTFGNRCNNNTFGSGCDNNTFGNSCSRNTFGNYCRDNIFGNGYHHNTFGNDCEQNTFGNGCNSNTLGNYCYNNTFGSSCDYNTFGTSSGAIDCCKNIIIDNECSYLNINSTDTTANLFNYLQNVHIHLGVKGGSSSNRLTIEVPDRNLPYSTTILAPGSKEIILDEEE